MSDTSDILTHLADAIGQFVDGFTERIQFNDRITLHTDACTAYRNLLEHGDADRNIPPEPGKAKHHHCHCPQRVEARAEPRRQPALLTQLYALHEPLADGDAVAVVGGTQPSSTPPGSLDALDLLGDIRTATTDLTTLMRTALEEDQAPPRELATDLRGLVSLASQLDDASPLPAEALDRLRGLISRARILLTYDEPMVQLRWTYCPECGGALMVRRDATSDVRCAGGPVEGPARKGQSWPVVHPGCGAVWARWQWVDLLPNETNEENHD